MKNENTRNVYDRMLWAHALDKKNHVPKDMEAHLIEKQQNNLAEDEMSEDALEKTAQILFDLPVNKIPEKLAIQEASRKAVDDQYLNQEKRLIESIKIKLDTHGVDPVELGIISKKEWDTIENIEQAEKIAKNAAAKLINNQKKSWQEDAINQANETKSYSHKYDPLSTKEGRISPTVSALDNSAVFNAKLPKNSSTLSDPEQIDKFAAEPNEHDDLKKSSQEENKSLKESSKNWRTEEHIIPDDLNLINGSRIVRAGGKDRDEIRGNVPSNKVSMFNDIKGNTAEEIKNGLEQLFSSRIKNSKEDTKKANEDRKKQIQREEKKEEEKESWEKVESGPSTKKIQERLAELWIPKEK